MFVTAATGSVPPKTGSNLTFNSNTGILTATGFAGPVTGNVTGNASGTAATVTGGTQSAITTTANLVSVGALDTGSITSGFTSIDVGSGAITTTGAIAGGTIDATTDFTIGGLVITDNTITDDGTLVIASTTATSFSEGNITNVGDIGLDSLTADGTTIHLMIK